MKTLSSLFTALIMFVNIGMAQVTGSWKGELKVQGATMRLVMHIAEENGTYTGKLDSPDQNAFGIPMSHVAVKENEVELGVSLLKMEYKGTYKAEGQQIVGVFKQGSFSTDMTLERASETKKATLRPQDPQAFPYTQEEVVFENKQDGVSLAGTLTLPKNKPTNKIVILISGSGPQNRNEELMNHRPFLVVSDWLTRQGIAVLRYDDRGVGASTGDFATSTTLHFANDAEAAVAYIESRSDLQHLKIGLAGHSEGGIIAPIVASRNKNVDFLVLLAAPGVPMKQLLLHQVEDMNTKAGLDAATTAKNVAASKAIYDVVTDNPDLDAKALHKKLDAVLRKALESLPASTWAQISKEEHIKGQIAMVSSPWFRQMLSLSTASYLQHVAQPVLAINGALDVQVRSTENLVAIEKALKEAKNTNYKTLQMPKLNHLFQEATTGMPTEYGTIQETFNEKALKEISDWIVALTINEN